MAEEVTCSVCGETIGKGPQGLGLISHSNSHRREFESRYGRQPENYDEVRERLGSIGVDDDQLTIWESLTDDEQQSIIDPRATL